MSVKIEKAKPADAYEVLELLKSAGGQTDNLSFGAEGLGYTVEAEESYIASLENSADGIILVARVDGRIVGDATLNRNPRRMNHRGEFGVSVLREYWGRGVGTALTAAVLEYARDNGYELIDLQVRSDNQRAIRLYEKFGFRELCTYPGYMKHQGCYIDCDWMVLPLSDRVATGDGEEC